MPGKKKNSSKHRLPQVEVNVVSLMDILTSILFFVLMVSSFNSFSVLDGLGMQSGKASEDKKNVFSLKVTLMSKASAELYLGSLQGLEMQNEDQLRDHLRRQFKGNDSTGYKRVVKNKDFKKLLRDIQQKLRPIKTAFPLEYKAVLAIDDDIDYQNVIKSMEALKVLGAELDAYVYRNKAGVKEQSKVLFPQVILAER